MKKILIIFVFLCCLVSIFIYSIRTKQIPLELNNDVLKAEIVKYIDVMEKTKGDKPFITAVYYRNVNDSIVRYVISDDINMSPFAIYPSQSIFKVNKHKVLFIMLIGQANEKQFFKMGGGPFAGYIKEYFPEAYDVYFNRNGEPITPYHDKKWCLTFYKGKLIDKEVYTSAYRNWTQFDLAGK